LRWSKVRNGDEVSPFELDEPDIEAYCVHLRSAKDHAPATVNRRLQALRKFYGFAIVQGWTTTNPADGVPLLSEFASERSRFLTPEDVSRLLVTVRSGRSRWANRDWAVMQVFLGAGLKLSELTRLRLTDLHLEDDQPYLEVRGASDEPMRAVPLDDVPFEALQTYLSGRRAAPGVDHAFTNRDGNPLSTRSVQRLLHHYAEAADLEGLTTQALRYEYAKRVYEDCDDLETVARLLGHRHLATTIRYLRPGPPHEERSPIPEAPEGDSVENQKEA
jgi:site-specific recombinase XerD